MNKIDELIKTKEAIEKKIAEMKEAIEKESINNTLRSTIRRKFEVVLNDGTSKVYTSVRVACRELDISHSTLYRRLNDITINPIYQFSARYIN